MEKENIRIQAQANLAAIPEAARGNLMQQATRAITQLSAWQAADKIALTLSQDVEIPTQLLIQTALLQGKHVYLPRVQPKRQMIFVRITTDTVYEKHPFGMLEPVGDEIIDPADLDLVLVPGLAFSAAGDRIGFGGGYYDRWLPKTDATTVALVTPDNYFAAPTWPLEVTDQAVDQVVIVTPTLGGEHG